MGVIEQLMVDVRTWRSLVAGRLELRSPSAGHPVTAGPSVPPGDAVAVRVGTHPPWAA